MTEPEASHSKPHLLPPVYFLFCLIGGIGLHWVFPIARIIAGPYRLIAVLPFLIGGGLAIWALQLFTRRGTTIKPHMEPSVIVTTGPFRLSRNPIYLGMALILTAVAIALGSLVPFVAPLAFVLIINATFIPHEERNLVRVFGEEYAAYQRRVRRWL